MAARRIVREFLMNSGEKVEVETDQFDQLSWDSWQRLEPFVNEVFCSWCDAPWPAEDVFKIPGAERATCDCLDCNLGFMIKSDSFLTRTF